MAINCIYLRIQYVIRIKNWRSNMQMEHIHSFIEQMSIESLRYSKETGWEEISRWGFNETHILGDSVLFYVCVVYN